MKQEVQERGPGRSDLNADPDSAPTSCVAMNKLSDLAVLWKMGMMVFRVLPQLRNRRMYEVLWTMPSTELLPILKNPLR